ncbi:sporulation integral membrane protein YtvI [Anaeromicropila populeti]|uniref:Sporulation integral membrane protein YtvI n=1 Tax=Anaeromicropila populeti TaxID=37658 RepID=A0A1I6I5S1_9FIRM|nr:sporulation integral membrane protein YtvI [Anaeromicropila populeti]SFR62062.1 sporulation integral membrane protein YtvI [Anaeromicropila populeti]
MIEKITPKMKLLVFIVAISVFVIFSMFYILPYVWPFVLAYCIAKLLSPIVFFLHERFRIPMGLGSLITVFLFLIIIGILMYFFITTLLSQCCQLLKNLPVYRHYFTSALSHFSCICDDLFHFADGCTQNFLDCSLDGVMDSAKKQWLPSLTLRTVTIIISFMKFFTLLFIILVSAILIALDMTELKEKCMKSCFYPDIHNLAVTLSESGLKYLKMQGIITLIISAICTLGIYLSKSSYPLLFGVIIGILDALPLIGSGTILVPWAIFKVISQNYFSAAILMTTYLCCQITRQFLEPRLIGNSLGFLPIYTLMSIYIGLKLYGLTGVILGPLSLLLIQTLYRAYKNKLNI